MEWIEQSFGQDELATLRLRRLFEARGFKRVRVGKFEEYALYVDNKNFLDTESVITFMDLDGKLLALKPDVTLSIVKNMQEKVPDCAQKLYYIDEVYRLSRENREYKVHSQIGVELIGAPDSFANLEIVELALDSLETISEKSLLDVSHMGFITGLLEPLGLSHREEKLALDYIHAKNTSDLATFLEQAGGTQEQRERVLALVGIHGAFDVELKHAQALICSEKMQDAFDELSQMTAAFNGGDTAVNLDFSVVNDLDYYNGLIFRGYVEGIPKLVLTGGRYDGMMRRLKKQSGAVGFAISLGELNTYLKSNRRYDFDTLITYLPNCDYKALLHCRKALCNQGKSVRLERSDSEIANAGFTFREHMIFSDGVLSEFKKGVE